MDLLKEHDGLALAALVKNKQVSPLELVEASIARIEQINPQINAVIYPLFEEAKKLAQAPLAEGPFAGVPFLLKDLLATLAGVPMFLGTKVLKEEKPIVPPQDSELVRRIKGAGFLLMGKTNTPELGLQPTTEPKAFGPTRNPWDVTRSAGGSSGGSAAAVATSMVPLAHGNDGGGSVRIPASCCGIFGLKPSRGRISLAPTYGDILNGLITEGVLTRTVRDAAAWLDAVHGPMPGDPYNALPPQGSYLESLQTKLRPLKIAFSTKAPLGVPIDQDCIQATEETAKLLSELGHQIVERDIKISADYFTGAFVTVWSAGLVPTLKFIEEYLGHPLKKEDFEPMSWALFEIGKAKSAGDYLQAIRDLQLVARQLMAPYEKEDIDVYLTPTLGKPPVAIGELDSPPEDPLRGFYGGAAFVPFTALCNITGQPAVSVPLFWNKADLPIGSHLMGRMGGEATLLQLAAQLEETRPWKERRPIVA